MYHFYYQKRMKKNPCSDKALTLVIKHRLAVFRTINHISTNINFNEFFQRTFNIEILKYSNIL